MIIERIELLRSLMTELGFDGYIVPTNDEYLSEYTPAYAKRIEYITGFSGSYCIAIILEKTVLFFTDGRYLTQCLSELDGNLFEIFDHKLIPNFDLSNYLTRNTVIAYDPKLFTNNSLKKFAGFNLISYPDNLIDKIWTDRPAKPNSLIYDYPLEYAGRSREEKINSCREFIRNNKAESLLITDSASVCWLLNIRASDVEFAPLLLANIIVTLDKIYLFTDPARFEQNLIIDEVTILPPSELEKILSLCKETILYDDNQCTQYISALLKDRSHKNIKNPCMLLKACKNDIEIKHMKSGHIQDAVAMCEFLSFLAGNDLSELTEYDLGERLRALRQKGLNYIYDSFPTIIGFQENGAIIHYRADNENAKKIKGDGLLLIDSGGQYLGATTDVTRTISIGNFDWEHKEIYTTVLKGHINLAAIRFPKERTTGANLDILARQFLWQKGLDYAHGTGHGVGSFSSVHEGPQNISPSGHGEFIQAGTVLSDEPGFYRPGKFGIRIENMIYAKDSTYPGFLEFEMLTLVPYERKLIDLSLLTDSEKSYLSSYYLQIKENIRALLSKPATKWLDYQLEEFI